MSTLQLPDLAAAFVATQCQLSGPLLACPVVLLKTRFSLSLAGAEALAQQLHERRAWRLYRTAGGMACAEVLP
ncbi:hypothetical protein FHW58_001867 [Duganella sp. 1224]|uniref:hypothetical protein n=1 Tax=Duganella sp. 1224 TaxID=2587052 RepID=UPI0015C70120|nr:hypothetical protein [Duganella sp. 1224]NYE60715.1 hypothetical protein [Duganella sp. 1224]